MKMRGYLVIALLFFVTACFAEKDGDSTPVANPSANPFQEHAIKIFTEYKDAKVAYLLLSSSGYANNGQYFVLDTGSQAIFYAAKAGEKELSLNPALTEAKRAEFLSAMQECTSLESLQSKIYDGVQYRFVRFAKVAGIVSEVQNLTMNNPELVQGAVAHQKLVKSFLSLVTPLH